MNTDTILRLLENSGFHVLKSDSQFLYLEDPSCMNMHGLQLYA